MERERIQYYLRQVEMTKRQAEAPSHVFTEMATKTDLLIFREQVDRRLSVAEEQMAHLRTDFTGQMANLRTDLTGQMASLRTELTGQMGNLQTELSAQMVNMRIDLSGQTENYVGTCRPWTCRSAQRDRPQQSQAERHPTRKRFERGRGASAASRASWFQSRAACGDA